MSDEYTITTRSEGLLGKIGQWGAALITDEELLEALDAHDAEVRAGVVTEEPEGPTSMKPFHREYPGLPRLFHTYCSEHPDFGTCEEEVQAHRDIADHLASEHYEVKQEEAEDA